MDGLSEGIVQMGFPTKYKCKAVQGIIAVVHEHLNILQDAGGEAEVFPVVKVQETLSAAKTPKKDGKGNPYAETIRVHMPLLDAMQTASRKVF